MSGLFLETGGDWHTSLQVLITCLEALLSRVCPFVDTKEVKIPYNA